MRFRTRAAGNLWEMEIDPTTGKPLEDDGEHNALGFRNVDEDATHDESPGTQGPGAEPVERDDRDPAQG